MAWSYTTGVLTSTGATESSPDTLLAGIAIVQASDTTRGYRNGFVAWLNNVEVRVSSGTFIIIDDDSQIELLGSSFINPQSGGVIHGNRSTLILSTSTGRVDNACDFETGSTFICRRQRPNDPNPRIIYRNTQRHDYPNIQANSTPARVEIAGLDMYNAGATAQSFLKVYFGRATTNNVSNVRAFNFGTTNFFQMFATTYNDSYLESLGITSEFTANDVVLNRPTFYLASAGAFNDAIRGVRLLMRNPTFLNNCWNGGIGVTQQSSDSRLSIVYTYTNIFRQGLTSVENVRIRFSRQRESSQNSPSWTTPSNAIITATSNAIGTFTAIDLLDAYREGTSGNAIERFNWTAKARVYDKRTAGETIFASRVMYQHSVIMSAGYNEEVQLISVPNLTLTEAQANALSGISIQQVVNNVTLIGTTSANAVVGNQTLLNNTTRTRYVMLRRQANQEFDLNEIQVIANGVNVAINKSVTLGSQGFFPGFTGANAVDGNTETMYASGGASANSWLQLDLGSEFNVTSVILTPRPGLEFRMTNVCVYASPFNLTAWANSVNTFAGSSTVTPTQIDPLRSVITISSLRTISELWQYYRAWICQTANFDTEDTWTYDGTNLNIGASTITGIEYLSNGAITTSTATAGGAFSIEVIGTVNQATPTNLVATAKATTLVYNTNTATSVAFATGTEIGTVRNDGTEIVTITGGSITDYTDAQINYLDSNITAVGITSVTIYQTEANRDSGANPGATFTNSLNFKYGSVVSGVTMQNTVYLRVVVGTITLFAQLELTLGSNILDLGVQGQLSSISEKTDIIISNQNQDNNTNKFVFK